MSKLTQAEFTSLFFTDDGARRAPSFLELIDNKPLKDNDNLNTTLQEGPYQGASVAWFLSSYHDGLSFLQKRMGRGLLDKIEVDAEPVGQGLQGRTLLWQLASTQEGLQILKKHPQLLLKGNLGAAPADGERKGETVLKLLASSSVGLGILLNNSESLQEKGLNTSPNQEKPQGVSVFELIASCFCCEHTLQRYRELLNENGLNALLWLMAESPEGQQALYQNPALFKNISLQALNFAPTNGPHAGISIIWFLASTALGAKILQQHRQLLQQGDFNAAPTEGEHAGITALWCLVSTPEGLNILLNNSDLLQKGDLNASPKEGHYQGINILNWLAEHPQGLRMLKQHPDLLSRSDLTMAPKEGPYKNISTLWKLARAPEGQQLLHQHPEFLKNQDAATLNASPVSDPHAGKSIIWHLSRTSLGVKILQQHPHLLAQGHFNTASTQGEHAGITALWGLASTSKGRGFLLNNVKLLLNGDLNAHPKAGPTQGISILSILAFTPEGRQILQQHPELLNRGDLTIAPAEGPFKNTSVLWELAKTSEGQQLLAQDPEILLNHDTYSLYTPCINGPHSGKSVIWLLANTPLGRNILQEYPQLLCENLLNTCPKSGEDAGKTILWLLANSPEGIEILRNRPGLLKYMVNVSPFNGPRDRTILRLLARSSAGLQLLKENTDLLEKENINPSEAEEIYMLMAAHFASGELIENPPSQDENRFSVFESWSELLADVEPRSGGALVEEIISSNAEAEPQEVEEVFKLMAANMFIEEPLEHEPYPRHYVPIKPAPLPEKSIIIDSSPSGETIGSDIDLEQSALKSPAEGHALGKRLHAPSIEIDDIDEPDNKQIKLKESDTLSNLKAVKKVKAPWEKCAYFSAKYFETSQSVPEMHSRKPTSRLSGFNQIHPFISLQSCQSTKKHAGGDFLPHPVANSQSSMTLYSHYRAAPSSSNTVTFVFAGRKERAMLPDIKKLGTDQRIVMVVSSDEFESLSQWQYPTSVEFLVVDALSSETHGHYDNTGSIQARRLAAFLASWHWQLGECLYLDDNIKALKFVGDNNSPVFTWNDVSGILQKERLTSDAIISGLETLTAKPFLAEQDYCYKVFSLNFTQVKTLLMMNQENDVFVLGYPGAHALNCMEDYYFQMIIDFALDYQQKQHNKFLSCKLLTLMDDALGGFERCNKDSGIAKKISGKLEAITKIDEATFSIISPTQLYQGIMRQSLQHLKHNIQMSLQRNQLRFEKTKKADYREILCHNRAISALHTFFKPTNHAIPESSNPQETDNRQKSGSKKSSASLQSVEVLNQWQGEPLAGLIKTHELESYLSEESVQTHTYPHQKDALRQICASKTKNGVVKMTTGSGKTRVEILLANFLIRKNPQGVVHIVVPTTQLLGQFHHDFCAVLDLLGESSAIDKKNITPVGSGDSFASKSLVNHNDIFREQSSVYIFCARSYALYLQDARTACARKPLITMLDEFHLYKTDARTLLKSELTTLGFSATPYDEAGIIFDFSRVASQKDNITVPLIVDKLSYSLKGDKKLSTIANLLKAHRHPGSGLPLFNHKGIIYVNSIDEADKLAQHINQKYETNLACAVHSENSSRLSQINAFKQKTENGRCILVAVDMLTTGYDDKALSWCLIAKNNTTNHSLIHQISGRVLRFNPENDQKIGYVLADCDFKEEIFECHKDREAIKRAHPDYFISNIQLIYFELLNAIHSNLPFERFESLFTENKLTHLSLSKHLGLLLEALLQNHDGIGWQRGLIQHDACLHRLYNDKNQQKNLNIVELFLYKAYGACIGKLEDGEYRLYTEANFKSLLEGIKSHNPSLLEYISSERFVESTQYYLALLGIKKGVFENILNDYAPGLSVDNAGNTLSI